MHLTTGVTATPSSALTVAHSTVTTISTPTNRTSRLSPTSLTSSAFTSTITPTPSAALTAMGTTITTTTTTTLTNTSEPVETISAISVAVTSTPMAQTRSSLLTSLSSTGGNSSTAWSTSESPIVSRAATAKPSGADPATVPWLNSSTGASTSTMLISSSAPESSEPALTGSSTSNSSGHKIVTTVATTVADGPAGSIGVEPLSEPTRNIIIIVIVLVVVIVAIVIVVVCCCSQKRKEAKRKARVDALPPYPPMTKSNPPSTKAHPPGLSQIEMTPVSSTKELKCATNASDAPSEVTGSSSSNNETKEELSTGAAPPSAQAQIEVEPPNGADAALPSWRDAKLKAIAARRFEAINLSSPWSTPKASSLASPMSHERDRRHQPRRRVRGSQSMQHQSEPISAVDDTHSPEGLQRLAQLHVQTAAVADTDLSPVIARSR
eukprot:INCI5003.14.p1 GENE.INCI5003.14~~INCI5003.14.p1  ORF type:complete len:437 (+),score=60.29 INCI5003.14:934-2244(+)